MNNPSVEINLPDRYDILKRKAEGQLSQIISPVQDALNHIDNISQDMRASSRGSFMVLRGDSGTGKSTFIHTVGLFRENVEIISISKEEDIGKFLSSLSATLSSMRIIVFEGREALTDVSNELLEKSIHAINSFIRTEKGEMTLIAWPVNRDDLAEKLAHLSNVLGAESLSGIDGPVYIFKGPEKQEYLNIAKNTIALLNQGENIHDLGISNDRANELVSNSKTIGELLVKIRSELLSNQKTLKALSKTERCRVWIVILAGNEPDSDIDAITRGTMYSADVDRMLSVTNANIVHELKTHPEKIGMIGTYFDARILHIPILAALAAVRSYADQKLKNTMKNMGMQVISDKKVKDRFSETGLVYSFKNKPIGSRKVGGKVGSNSTAAFEKLTTIASNDDVSLNKALAECLKDMGLIKSYTYEEDFGGRLTRRTDIVAVTDEYTVRLEIMWRKKTGRAEISNYALTKLYNYGKAVGYL
ncbi:hypothetical protein [Methylophilus luteus]|uniref:ATP-binding protein n=1 Tax=Methylophilus luteus TaxID=640108 RepID=A0ABW3FBW0_9PROT